MVEVVVIELVKVVIVIIKLVKPTITKVLQLLFTIILTTQVLFVFLIVFKVITIIVVNAIIINVDQLLLIQVLKLNFLMFEIVGSHRYFVSLKHMLYLGHGYFFLKDLMIFFFVHNNYKPRAQTLLKNHQ
jgi:hypothetical protein